ncbi:hypothetical protein OHR86_24885 [Streptomyces sp. NBC_00441]|uniref:hypothetical protein n=1 Tax=Streptomyces sp. NBC_00441 TaxID=2975742 RepID=UPI002E27EAA7|nr:hypothetical protein [Streptomyces sp. NBC_00441]
MFGSELHVSVARPPVEAEHANLLALEHISRPRTTSSTTRPHRSPNTRRASGDGPPGRSGGTMVVGPVIQTKGPSAVPGPSWSGWPCRPRAARRRSVRRLGGCVRPPRRP